MDGIPDRTAVGTPLQCFSCVLWTALATAILAQPAPPAFAQTVSGGFAELSSRAEAARQSGDIPGAIRLYQQSVQLNPQWSLGWWYLGVLQYGASAYAPAAEALTHYLALNPQAGPALALRGDCEFQQGQYPEALHDLQQALAFGSANDPRNEGILHYREALLLTRLGRFEEALAQYTALIRHGVLSDPAVSQNVISGLGLAGLHRPLLPGDIDPAQQPLITATGQAAAAVMGGDFASGHAQFGDLFSRFPSTPWLHYLYGYLLFQTDPAEAIAQFQQELQVSPSNAVVHAMLAWALGMQGDFAAALPAARAAVSEDASLPMAQLVLGRDLLETGKITDGLPYLLAALKMDPQNLEVHLALVRAYSELGRKDDARRERLLCLTLAKKRLTPDDANL